MDDWDQPSTQAQTRLILLLMDAIPVTNPRKQLNENKLDLGIIMALKMYYCKLLMRHICAKIAPILPMTLHYTSIYKMDFSGMAIIERLESLLQEVL